MAIGTAAAALGGAAISGALGAKGAKDAAKSQAASADAANSTQLLIDGRNRSDQQPWMDRGNAAGNRLSYMLGLSTNPGTPGSGSLSGARLIEMHNGVPSANQDLYANNADYRKAWDDTFEWHRGIFGRGYNEYSDTADLQRILLDRLRPSMQKESEAAQHSTASDPAYGSLLRNFSAADLEADPIYQSGLQFALSEGTKGLNRIAAANGGLNSGATAKALARFGAQTANQFGNDAYNRSNTNKLNQFNMLSGVAGTGQAATNQVTSSASNMANNISQNQIGVGNARAASAIAQGNAWGNAIGQGVNIWQQNRLMNQPGGWTNGFDLQ